MSLCNTYGIHFRGCTGEYGADFFFYDPIARRRFSQREYEQKLVHGRPQVSPGHPTGFAYDEVIEE